MSLSSYASDSVSYLIARAAGAKSDSVLTGVDPSEYSASNPLRLFIIQAAIIICLTRLLGVALTRLNQPRVIAEVIGGIILGPTVMGRIPGFSEHIFPPVTPTNSSLTNLNLVANLGLVLFLFLVGLEVDFRVIKKCAKEAAAISLAGMVLPFGLGAAVSVGIFNEFIKDNPALTKDVDLGHFILFTGVAMAITAFPVLARILTENKLLQTNVGVIVLAAGVGNDVVGWILLALTIALVNASTGLTALYVLLCAVGWTLALFFLIKPVFLYLCRRTGSLENGPSQLMMTITILLVLVSAWMTDVIGVHAIFGGFLVGLIIPHEGGFAVAMTEKIEDIVSVLFLPLYFALSGLKTNLGALDTGIIWGYTIAIIVIAFFSKFIGCAGAARVFGFSNRESAAIGTLMSCKGLVELIVLNIGLSAGILDTRVFSMFVVMAVVSTVATTPLTLWAYPKEIRRSIAELFGDSKSHHSIAAGDKAHSDDQDEGSSGSFASKKLLVVLDRFEHLPGLMTLVQLIQPSESRLRANVAEGSTQLRRRSTRKGVGASTSGSELDGDSIKEGSSSETEESSPNALAYSSALNHQQQLAFKPELSIDALRLIELTERTSAVMRDAESEDTLRADPILNVFRTFSHLNRIPVTSSMSIVNLEEYSNTVVSRAKDSKANLVVVPWSLPKTNLNSGSDNGGVLNAIASPFGNLFGGASSSNNNNETSSNSRSHSYSPHQAQFVRRVFQNSDCDVGLFLERSSESHQQSNPILSMSGSNHLLLSFMGGPDDRVALSLATRLAKSNEGLKLTVLMFKRTAADEIGDDNDGLSLPPTMHHNQSNGNTIQNNQLTIGGTAIDTMYPGGNKPSALEASLEDDLALKAAQDELRESGLLPTLDPQQQESSNDFIGDRISFKQINTPRPLNELIKQVEELQPSLLILGRGRRLPTLTHRDELKGLLSNSTFTSTGTDVQNGERENRFINSETCKVVGEPAMALTLAKTFPHTLVIASSMKARSNTQEA